MKEPTDSYSEFDAEQQPEWDDNSYRFDDIEERSDDIEERSDEAQSQPDSHLESEYEDRTHVEDCDDFETYNQNEADDYRNESLSDS